MRQASLKFKSYTGAVSIVDNSNLYGRVFHFILVSFGALAFLYVFLLGNMVLNIVERRSLEADVRSLSSEVRNLEVTYLSLSNNIDLPLSHSLGFQETKATFATRKSLGLKTSSVLENRVKMLQNDI